MGALPAVIIAGAIGYGLYRLVRPSGVPQTPHDLARLWFSYVLGSNVALFGSQMLSGTFKNGIPELTVGCLLMQAGGYLVGYLWGTFVRFPAKHSEPTRSPIGTTKNPATATQPISSAYDLDHSVGSMLTNNGGESSPSNYTPYSREQPTASTNEIYAQVAEELESKTYDKGLWTMLYAQHDGDETKTKVAYIKRRAEQLSTQAKAANQAPRPCESVPDGLCAAPDGSAVALTYEQKERMSCYGITPHDGKFFYQSYLYDDLDDALADAKKTVISEIVKKFGIPRPDEQKPMDPAVVGNEYAACFFELVANGYVDLVREMAESNISLLAIREIKHGNSPLHVAIAEQQYSVARLLAKMHAPLGAMNNYGLTAYDYAKDQKHKEMMELLKPLS